MREPVIAYHFTSGWELRGGQKLVVGKEYVYDGEPIMCDRGYHASRHIADALNYAPGAILSLVECRDVTDSMRDKLVCKRRKVIKTIDATNLLRKYARMCALDVIHLWDAPEVVIRYLKTGDESMSDAAGEAARAAAWTAAGAAARAAARAAWTAAGAAAGEAARAAAWTAAWTAARAALIKKQRRRLSRMVREAFKEES